MLNLELQKHIKYLHPKLGEILSIEQVKEGYLGNNHILKTSTKKYFLKQYMETYTEEEIKDVHSVIKFFSGNNIPVVSPIPDIRGQTYFIFSSKIYSLFPFINAVLKDRKDINENSAKSLARVLAQIHLLSRNGSPIQIKRKQEWIDTRKFLNTYSEIIKIIKAKRSLNNFDKLSLRVLKLRRSIVEKNIQKIKDLKFTADHLLHGDFHEKNVFFNENGEVKYIFDWEKTTVGSRLHELIRSMDYIFMNGEYSEQNIKRAKFYIQTYNNFYPFHTEDFLNAIQYYYLKKAHSLWIERTHYIEKSNRVDVFLEKELGCLNYFPNNYKDFVMKLDL